VVFNVAVCLVAPLGLSERAARLLLKRDVWFRSHGQLLGLIPGKTGWYLRNAYYRMTLKSCPPDCCFEFGSAFTHSGAVVGHRVYIGVYSRVGLATLGDDTLIGDNVHILSGKYQHSFADRDRRIWDQPQLFTRIYVGSNCWLGTNTVVMADIGNNSVVGASSVVTHAILDNMIAAGNPARSLRPRPGGVKEAERQSATHSAGLTGQAPRSPTLGDG
jgi:virginiamycin A acetyltransferase